MVNLRNKAVHIVNVMYAADYGSGGPIEASRGRKLSQDGAESRARRNTIRGNYALGIRDLLGCGHQKSEIRGHPLALPLIGAEEKSLLLDDRAANGCAELVISELAFGDVISGRIDAAIEKVAGVEQVVAHELKR